jgi:small subunit ribosomal protein S19
MSRSNWKGIFIKQRLLKKNIKKIWSRNSCIPYVLIGQRVLVHNGNEFKKIFITREKVGYKFGSFSFTRNYTKKIKVSKIKK